MNSVASIRTRTRHTAKITAQTIPTPIWFGEFWKSPLCLLFFCLFVVTPSNKSKFETKNIIKFDNRLRHVRVSGHTFVLRGHFRRRSGQWWRPTRRYAYAQICLALRDVFALNAICVFFFFCISRLWCRRLLRGEIWVVWYKFYVTHYQVA